MNLQQHDGVVVDAAVIAAGLRRASARGRGVAGEREASRLQVRLPSLPLLYIGPLGGGRRPWIPSTWGEGGGGQGGNLPPKSGGAPPTPRVSNPRRRGRPMGGAPAH